MDALKIVSLLIIIQAVNSIPLLFHEVNSKKSFEFSLKPIKIKPIGFIKEAWWSPLGHIGKKHVIEKRSPFEITPVAVPAQHDKIPPLIKVPLRKSLDIPQDISPGSPALLSPKGFELENELYPHFGIRQVPRVIPPGLVPKGRLPDLEEPHNEDHLLSQAGIFPVPPPPLAAHGPLDLPGLEKAEVQEGIVPPPPVSIPSPVLPVPLTTPELIPPEPVQKPNVSPRVSMFTDIARADEINAYLKTVESLPLVRPPLEVENILPVVPGNGIESEAPKNPVDDTLNSSSLVKGSRLALYFGNILLQVMSEVISSARSAISQYSNKPATM